MRLRYRIMFCSAVIFPSRSLKERTFEQRLNPSGQQDRVISSLQVFAEHVRSSESSSHATRREMTHISKSAQQLEIMMTSY